MFRSIRIMLIVLLCLSGCKEYTFSFEQNQKSPIDAQQTDFFILRYVAWKECKVGGTLNEVAIKNDGAGGSDPLLVSTIELSMVSDGVNVTAKDAPRINTDNAISNRAEPVNRRSILPGEWLYFSFPVDNCDNVIRSDEMEIRFHVVLVSGEKRYENEAIFKKIVTSSPFAWP